MRFQSLGRDSVLSNHGTVQLSHTIYSSFNPSVGILFCRTFRALTAADIPTEVSIPRSGFCFVEHCRFGGNMKNPEQFQSLGRDSVLSNQPVESADLALLRLFQSLGRDSVLSNWEYQHAQQRERTFQSLGRDSVLSNQRLSLTKRLARKWFQSLGRDSVLSNDDTLFSKNGTQQFQSLGRDSVLSNDVCWR